MNSPEFNLQFQRIDRLANELKQSQEYQALMVMASKVTQETAEKAESAKAEGIDEEQVMEPSNEAKAYQPSQLAQELKIKTKEEMANFLFFWNLINYHTSSEGESFTGKVKVNNVLNENQQEQELTGIALLWTLIKQEQQANPELFKVNQLINAEDDKLMAMMVLPNGRGPSDVAGRINLLREGAKYLQNNYAGNVLNIFERYAEQANSGEEAETLLTILMRIPGYQDKQGHKAKLLLKMVVQEGLLEEGLLKEAVERKESITVIADKTLMTMAVRTGIVDVWHKTTQNSLHNHDYIGINSLVDLRVITPKAWGEVARKMGVAESWLDEVIWQAGQEILQEPAKEPQGLKNELVESEGTGLEAGETKAGEAKTVQQNLEAPKTVKEIIQAQKYYDAGYLVKLPFTRFL